MIRLSRRGRKVRDTILACLFVAVFLFPFYSAILCSLTPYDKLGNQHILPHYFRYQSYIEIWTRNNIARGLMNSSIYAFGITITVLCVAIPAAYCISRFRFTGRKAYLFMILWTQMLPQVIIVLPLFVLIRSIGIADTYLSVIVTASALNLPFPIWLLKGYFDTISFELDEAAMIDGCTRLQALIKIIIPTARPGILTAAILTLTEGWALFLIPLVLVADDDKQPLTTVIYRMLAELQVRWDLVMAATMVGVAVSVILFSFIQKYVVGGLMTGAIKE